MKQEQPSQPGRSLSDKLICAARSGWYGLTEGPRLEVLRAKYDDWYLHSKPFVSVYIPTHNRAKILLSRALPSVMAQTYRNFEVVVAAHGCDDGTCRQVRERFPNVRVLPVPRTQTYPPTAENHWLAGPVVPANAALEACRGDWIARIDDDDVWRPDHLIKLLDFAVRNEFEFVSSAYETERDGKRKIIFPEGEPPIGGTQTWVYRSYLKFMRYNPDCYRKKWDRVNDMDLADRFRKAGVWIGALDEVTAEVLPRPGESTVGLAAYLRDAENKEREFSF